MFVNHIVQKLAQKCHQRGVLKVYNTPMRPMSLFAETERLKKLANLDSSLVRLSASVDRSIFQHALSTIFVKENKSANRRPTSDYVVIFNQGLDLATPVSSLR